MPPVIQQHSIPEVIRALSGMESPDYIDLFTVTTNGAADASPDRWSRAAIEDARTAGQDHRPVARARGSRSQQRESATARLGLRPPAPGVRGRRPSEVAALPLHVSGPRRPV